MLSAPSSRMPSPSADTVFVIGGAVRSTATATLRGPPARRPRIASAVPSTSTRRPSWAGATTAS
ncbi:MAG TPA: hypothetical protein PKB03_04815, partial [Baekduia sp.]|nr:hypothetical protein [Baekduia sp.]